MVIEKVHGLQSTELSLHERFTILTIPERLAMLHRRTREPFVDLHQNNPWLKQVARQMHLQRQANQAALRQRLGFPTLRRFGSENGLNNSNNFGNQRTGNLRLRRSASFNDLANIALRRRPLRGYSKRGGGQRVLRGRFRVGRQGLPRFQQRGGFGFQQRNVQQRNGFQGRGGQRRGVQRRRGVQHRLNVQQTNGQQGAGPAQNQWPQISSRGARGGARGGRMTRSQSQNLKISKEDLDRQLDEYMACTKAALDQQLDIYMKNAMELE